MPRFNFKSGTCCGPFTPCRGSTKERVLALAALSSSDGGQDPVDGAIRAAVEGRRATDALRVLKFVLFDPATKISGAMVGDQRGGEQRVVKGAFTAVVSLDRPSPDAIAISKELEGKGFGVLAVASGLPNAMKLAGLIALSDPPRPDKRLSNGISELHQ